MPVAVERVGAVVGESELARETLNGAESGGGNSLAILPVAGPGDAVELAVGRALPGLEGVPILGELGAPGNGISSGEGLPVPVTNKVLYRGAAKRSAGIDRDEEHPELLPVVWTAFDGDSRETGTLVLVAKEAAGLEPADLSPRLEVERAVENDSILLWMCNRHDPLTTSFVPEDLRVTELCRVDGENWTGVLGEGNTVVRVGKVLVLCCSGVEGVDGNEAVLRVDIVVEETGGVVSV